MVAAIGAIAGRCCSAAAPAPAVRRRRGRVAQVRTTARTDGYHGVLLDEALRDARRHVHHLRRRHPRPVDAPVAPVTLVFFGYSHCPDVCNAVLADVAAALRRADDTVRERTTLLFVTTDPARDTPEVMRDYLARFDPSFLGLRTDLETDQGGGDLAGGRAHRQHRAARRRL